MCLAFLNRKPHHCTHQRGDVPGWKRAAVFIEPATATLGVVVEVRYLSMGMSGKPYETEAYADRRLEDALVAELRAAFE